MPAAIYFNVFAFCCPCRLFIFSRRITNSFWHMRRMRHDTPQTIYIHTHIVACLIDTAWNGCIACKDKIKTNHIYCRLSVDAVPPFNRHSRATCISEFNRENICFEIQQINERHNTDQKIECQTKFLNASSIFNITMLFGCSQNTNKCVRNQIQASALANTLLMKGLTIIIVIIII